MKKQTDQDIKDLELAPGITVQDYGCLITAIYNAIHEQKKYLSFVDVLSVLKEADTFGTNGMLQWKPAQHVLNFKHIKIMPKHFKNIRFSNDPKIFWIAEIPHYSNPCLSHFVNIIATRNKCITYFDVYDGATKKINLSDCRSVRELHFT